MPEAITTTTTSTELKVQPSTIQAHMARCNICRHPDRELMDEEYVNWKSAKEIAIKYNVSYDSICHHINATGLKDKQALNIKTYLLKIMKTKTKTPPKVSDKIEAAKIVAKMTRQLEPDVQNNVAVQVNNFSDMADDQLQAYIDAKYGKLKRPGNEG